MALRDASGSQKIVIYCNAVIRFAQFVVAAVVIGVYAHQKGYWIDHGIPSRITYELVVGSLSLITALVFGVIPFFLSFHPVALGAAWDIILMIMWGAAFGLMKAIFLRTYEEGSTEFFHYGSTDPKDELNHWNGMVSAAFINLAGLILFLISAIVGVVLLFIGRRNKSGGYV